MCSAAAQLTAGLSPQAGVSSSRHLIEGVLVQEEAAIPLEGQRR